MPQKPPGDQLTFRNTFNILCIVCSIHARCVTPFLRSETGAAARGLFSFIAGAFMFYLACALYDQPFIDFWGAWLVALILQSWDSAATRKKGKAIHSQYDGRPSLAMLLCPFVKDEGTAKFIVEPAICLGVGYGLLGWSDALGKLVMSCAFSLLFLENYYRHVTRQREQQVIDARIEAEALSQGVRERLGDYR